MRRSSLLTLTALGALICLIGGTGLFAALTDTARTANNSVVSAPLAGSADIQLATADFDGVSIVCNVFSENLTSGFFSATDVAPGYASAGVDFCIRNVGSATVTLAISAAELHDVEVDCTGDEALYGDATCVSGDVGELSDVIGTIYEVLDCTTGQRVLQSGSLLKESVTIPSAALGTLEPGAVGCYRFQATYPENTTLEAVQVAQSDRAVWRYLFSAAS